MQWQNQKLVWLQVNFMTNTVAHWASVQYPLAQKCQNKVYFFCCQGTTHLPLTTWRKYCPWIFWSAEFSDWAQSQFSAPYPYQKSVQMHLQCWSGPQHCLEVCWFHRKFLVRCNCPRPPTENYGHLSIQYHPHHCYHQCTATVHHFLARRTQYHCFHVSENLFHQSLKVSYHFIAI